MWYLIVSIPDLCTITYFYSPTNTAIIACFQIRKKWSKKPLVYRPCIFKFATKLFFYPIPRVTFLYANNKDADQPAQFYQLSLESMIAKPATCKKKSCQTCVRGSRQFQPGGGGGGGGGRIASRGRFVPVFLLGNKWQLMILWGGPDPLPPLSPPISEFQTV